MIDSVSEQADAVDFHKAKKRKAAQKASNIDRLPPHNTEAEQGVLGCVLLSPNECLGQCIKKFKAGAEVFYDLRHQTIYGALVKMWDDKTPIDIITLQQRLKDVGMLEQIGSIPYLNALQDAVPSAANLSYYVGYVVDQFALRKLVNTCTDIVGRVYDPTNAPESIEEFLDEAEADILKIGDALDTDKNDTINAAVNRSIAFIENKFLNPGTIAGITTGLTDLDKKMDGMKPGNMIVIAARPSIGKTSLAMQIAEHVCCEVKLPVGVFSLEMTMDELTTRQLCSMARVNLRTINEGFMSESDFPKLTSAAGKLSKAPLFIDDTPGLSILQLRARARRLWQQHGIKLFVIDYLQLLHATSRKSQENRVQEITEISNGIKGLAKELGVPIVVLSQLNRELEKTGRKPKMSDLRESGAIEQDADLIGLLYRPNPEDEASTQEQADGIAVDLDIAKQRNGPTGTVHFTFLKPYTRFEAAAKITDDDIPSHQGTQQQWSQHNN